MLKRPGLTAAVLLCLSVSTVLAQPATQPAEQAAAPPKTTYEGDGWLNWKKMTGDWGGIRSQLADMGVSIDLNLTQVMQGNAHGGASTNNGFRYSGSADLTLTLDTKKLGLWEGGTIVLNAEPKWGDGINGKVGSLIPVNLDAVKPGYGEGAMMTLSEYFYQHVMFDGKLILLAGKLDGSRAFDTNVFANDERTQFMNVALRNNVMIPSFLPYTTLGVGAIVNPLDWLSIRTAVTDTEGRAKTTGFETTFHGPTHTTIIHEWDFKINPFDKPGHQRIGFVWSSMEVNHLNPKSPFKETGPLMMKLLGPEVMGRLQGYLPYDTSADNVMLYYNFDQYIFTEEQDPTQGIGLFGRFGWAREDVNPVEHFYSIGIGGKGVIPERDRDTFGIGYYHVDLSDDLPGMFHSEQGIELYYSIEIAPWLHISPDFQIVINPGGTDGNDVSLVYGLRMQMDL